MLIRRQREWPALARTIRISYRTSRATLWVSRSHLQGNKSVLPSWPRQYGLAFNRTTRRSGSLLIRAGRLDLSISPRTRDPVVCRALILWVHSQPRSTVTWDGCDRAPAVREPYPQPCASNLEQNYTALRWSPLPEEPSTATLFPFGVPYGGPGMPQEPS